MRQNRQTPSYKMLFPALVIAWLGIATIMASCGSDDETATPEASFDFEASGDLEFGIPRSVQFIDQSTSVGSGTLYSWDFGDGETSSDKNPVHEYATGGTYTVTLTLTNSGKESELSKELELSSPIVGTWKLDSAALSTIDSFAVKYATKTSMEYGNSGAWDGQKWTLVADDGSGYVPYWSHVIFGGNYLGRKSLFAVEYTFTADGTLEREEHGALPGVVYFSPEKDLYDESEDWVNGDGASLDDWKSGEFTWEMIASTEYPGRTELAIGGANGGFLGIYFAGSTSTVPAAIYTYTVALVNDNQLIVSGVSNLDFGYPSLFVLKFKRVQ